MATGGVGLCAFSASCSFALLSFARASGGERASDRAACCSWGVPWSRDARVEVRKWWFGTTMSTDATEDDMDLARTEEADIHPFECSGIAEVKGCTRGLSFCLIGGSGGRQRGLGGHENFADRDLEEKWPKFFLVCKRASSQGPGAWALPGLSRGSLCDVRPLCSYCGGHMGARRSPMWESTLFRRF